MNNDSVEQEILRTAHQIGTATSYEDLYDSQLSFWMSVQCLMRTGGYEAVRKRMAFISKELAEAIASAAHKDIKNLCRAEISTIRPSLPDSTILALLSPSGDDFTVVRMVLQILAEPNEETEAHG